MRWLRSTAEIESALAERGIPPGEAGRILSPSPVEVQSLGQDADDRADETLGVLAAATARADRS